MCLQLQLVHTVETIHLAYDFLLTGHRMVTLLCAIADTYEVRNAAQGPHKGSMFVSAETGAPGLGRLRPRHHVRNMAGAFKFLGFQSEEDIQKSTQRMLHLPRFWPSSNHLEPPVLN